MITQKQLEKLGFVFDWEAMASASISIKTDVDVIYVSFSPKFLMNMKSEKEVVSVIIQQTALSYKNKGRVQLQNEAKSAFNKLLNG